MYPVITVPDGRVRGTGLVNTAGSVIVSGINVADCASVAAAISASEVSVIK